MLDAVYSVFRIPCSVFLRTLIGRIKGRPDGYLMGLARKFGTERLHKGAAKITGKSGIVVGKNTDLHKEIVTETARDQKFISA